MIWPFNKIFKCKHDYGNYAVLAHYAEDGIGRVHARVYARVIQKCWNCGHKKEVCMIHIPEWVRDYKFMRDR